MEIEYDINYEYDELCTFRRIHEDKTDLCLVCLVDETEAGQIWTRYELACGHMYHSRCIRKWCRLKNCVHCTCCGEVADKVENMFCYGCQEFGHNCDLE